MPKPKQKKGSKVNPFPVPQTLIFFGAVAMDDAMETGNLAPYQERPRTFPNMRSKPSTPLVVTLSPLSLETPLPNASQLL
ncbi:hypothetical protein Ccrd_003884 [Cynara cardunculus var. scolymus]|uniref:Uncharacterized protein n=1 Tax=Cynara cardunculus var. scolymus TaxID=59895 RepID=A0A118JW57_CYNCS|nr:hypothetical protein Ccrd_003884 [Cynara cardunculus var. scolymus]